MRVTSIAAPPQRPQIKRMTQQELQEIRYSNDYESPSVLPPFRQGRNFDRFNVFDRFSRRIEWSTHGRATLFLKLVNRGNRSIRHRQRPKILHTIRGRSWKEREWGGRIIHSIVVINACKIGLGFGCLEVFSA